MLEDLALELAEAAITAQDCFGADPIPSDQLAAVLKARALEWLATQPLAARMLAWKAGLTDRIAPR